ncbi:CopG family ribbon-helix-helix protein [Brevundimonas sp. PAMC22021]|uniref:CopG family ribbon-helix-helix protein n=1 Tax=Brevundimonas sp. PAMC22021 TaxID=2861285 RepID=UPI001C625547|nr:ribbon-helix-helix protein, CopG family [Brevundimonas sp. PAMC22021]QYF87148.1 ribbon-helix-helix protein, CopG family [Brevundimonas sp. PAMC22021]
MTVHVTIALDDAVKAKLDALADARRVPVDEIVTQAVSQLAADDAAFHAAVEAGLASLDAGRGVPHEDVVARLRARQAKRARL